MENLNCIRNQFGNKRLLILGFAREGIDTLQFLRKLFPDKIIGIADQREVGNLELETGRIIEKEKNIRKHFGPDYLKSMGDYDVIIKAPGISPKVIKPFLKKTYILTSQTEIFFDNCPGKIIGITGTKGKSTAASLIYDILKTGGFPVHLIGNIGRPVLSLLLKAKPSDIFVYELSSHQLSGLKKSPNVAVFLNIYPEHLDYYRNFQEYLKAKQNICRYQKKDDFLLFNSRDKYVQETARFAKGKKIILSSDKTKSFMKKWGRPGLSIKLLGSFNFLNMAAAIEVGRIFKVPDKIIAKVISAFKPLPHRLEFVGEYQSIKFYNDSLATIPEATIAALDALGRNVETIFLGGFDRGLKFDKLAGRIMRSNLKNIIFFPPSGVRIWKKIEMIQGQKKRFFRDLFIDPERNYDNKKTDLVYNGRSSGVSAMKTAVKWAYEHTSKGKICLLSCASPSFGLFKDYRERGELFKRFVRTLS